MNSTLNHPLSKKLSIGITNAEMSTEEVLDFLSKYSPYIHDIYFSPCEEQKFQSRRNIYNSAQAPEKNIFFLDCVSDYARQLGIKLNLVINTRINPRHQYQVIEEYYKRYDIDILTTFADIAAQVHKVEPSLHIQCSFNQGLDSLIKVREIIDLEVFETLIIGSTLLRDFKCMKEIRNAGLKIKLLVNGGCVQNCPTFCRAGEICKTNFMRKVENFDVNYLYAAQSLYPEELYAKHLQTGLIDFVKISSRPIAISEFVALMDSYIHNETTSYLDASTRNFHLYARLGHFTGFYNQLNRSEISRYKHQIWEEILL